MDRDIKKLENTLIDTFINYFGNSPEYLVYSPGRVNLIGDHTDYNGGFVLPMAIDRYVVLAVKKRDDDQVTVRSLDFDETVSFSISSVRRGQFSWGEYISGSLKMLQEENHQLKGFDCVISGNIPVGASLSSSAALELGILRAAAQSSDLFWNPIAMAKVGQKAENQWVGMNCGIMDQTICAAGQIDHAILIDCHSMTLEKCPIPKDCSIVILDTATRRGLIDSAYNERRSQCTAAANIMNVELLRQADLPLLESKRQELTTIEYLRAKHVIEENERVLLSAKSMKAADSKELGRLMYESHESLRDNYEVSSYALNAMVECAMEQVGCLGARMTGAGFAGCAVALVQKSQEQEFIHSVGSCYQHQMKTKPSIYVCRAADGTAIRKV